MIKKTFLLITAIIFTIASCTKEEIDDNNGDTFEQGDLGGGHFDSWVVITQGEVSFDNPAFNWWASLNHLAVIGGPKTVTKTEDSKAGPYAARLETKTWGTGFVIPGMLISGKFDQTLPPGDNLVIGQPFNKKPQSFSGYYKYFPQGVDSCGFLVALTKYNFLAGMRDTIAMANFTSGGTIPAYTNFSLPFNYTSLNDPDSIHVVIIASISDGGMQGEAGTVLYVDELKLNYNK